MFTLKHNINIVILEKVNNGDSVFSNKSLNTEEASGNRTAGVC